MGSFSFEQLIAQRDMMYTGLVLVGVALGGMLYAVPKKWRGWALVGALALVGLPAAVGVAIGAGPAQF